MPCKTPRGKSSAPTHLEGSAAVAGAQGLPQNKT
jgi:hypothetical protein